MEHSRATDVTPYETYLLAATRNNGNREHALRVRRSVDKLALLNGAAQFGKKALLIGSAALGAKALGKKALLLGGAVLGAKALVGVGILGAAGLYAAKNSGGSYDSGYATHQEEWGR